MTKYFTKISVISVVLLVLTACTDSGSFTDSSVEEETPITPIALGQLDFSSAVVPGSVSASSFGQWEYKIHSDGTRLFVTDYMNSRVLIWNTMPTSFLQNADVVLGQATMTTNTCNLGGSVTAATLCLPGGVFSNGSKLFVADWGNHRVLIWNSIPTSNQTPADVVLGQANMTSNTQNSGGVLPTSINYPWHLTATGTKLIVSDYGNSRILIWNTIPTVNHTAADVVVGQANMNTNINGSISPTAASLSYPYEVATDGTKLIVADTGTNRILIWTTIPATNGVSANVVIGQADMTSAVFGAVSAQMMNMVSSVVVHGGKIYALDAGFNRLLIWNSIPTTNNVAADVVYGQPDMVSSASNNGGVSQTSLGTWPEGLSVLSDRIFIGDPENRRILMLPLP